MNCSLTSYWEINGLIILNSGILSSILKCYKTILLIRSSLFLIRCTVIEQSTWTACCIHINKKNKHVVIQNLIPTQRTFSRNAVYFHLHDFAFAMNRTNFISVWSRWYLLLKRCFGIHFFASQRRFWELDWLTWATLSKSSSYHFEITENDDDSFHI